MTPEPWHWLVAGFGLLILELLLPTGFILLWIGAAAICVGGLAWLLPALGLGWQFAAWGGLSLGAVLVWRGWRPSQAAPTDEPLLNRRGDSYVGRHLTLAEPIVDGVGRVHVDDSQWRIVGADLPAGSRVQVVSVEGTTLRVEASC